MQDLPAPTCTLWDFVAWLAPLRADLQAPPAWPPDLFAICASLLACSGGYRHVSEDWPPTEGWVTTIQDVGRRWQAESAKNAVPQEVKDWWGIIHLNQHLNLSWLAQSRDVCLALIQLCAAADCACSTDLESSPGKDSTALVDVLNSFLEVASWEPDEDLQPSHGMRPSRAGVTLCTEEIHPWRARVLFRCRTPQRGLTLRSLTHELALIRGSEVIPRWHLIPLLNERETRLFNVLLAPWPLSIARRCFSPAPAGKGRLRNLAQDFGFFNFDPRVGRIALEVTEWLDRLYAEALKEVGSVDLVVLPELALHPEEKQGVLEWAEQKQVCLIAGVGFSGKDDDLGENYVVLGMPFLGRLLELRQDKHHRWLLDRPQIETYGLAGNLNPAQHWWEPIKVPERCLELITLTRDDLEGLTMCALVCEDLAQQEPISELIRAVGPNLVIAVLMDGPQLRERWPARYAAVLADDPGSSVLTLTSLGMCERSQPYGLKSLRTIGMWRDGNSGTLRELTLAPGAQGMVLNLMLERRTEYSADGRSNQTAVRPVYVGSCDLNPGS